MKRLISLVMMIAMLASVAFAEDVVGGQDADVLKTMTQDSVLAILAADDDAQEDCVVEVLQPDDASIDLMNSVYQFVVEEKNNPAHYYDEETQQGIARLAEGIDIDKLFMTEAMCLQAVGQAGDMVTVTMQMNGDYQVGQLVIAVLGVAQENGEYTWYPYRGVVQAQGMIQWKIPAADWELFCQQPVCCHVLSDRVVSRGESQAQQQTASERHYSIFSKESDDVITVDGWHSANDEPVDDDFHVFMVERTDAMEDEILRIGDYLKSGDALLNWFSEENKTEAELLLSSGIDFSSLIAYDAIALQSENYKDAYGDVNVDISFATAYHSDKSMVVLAGFPVEDTDGASRMEWNVLRADAKETEADASACMVDIGLKQLDLPRMEEEPMLLLVISEPLDD